MNLPGWANRRSTKVIVAIVAVVLLTGGTAAVFILRRPPSSTANVRPDREARVAIGSRIVVDVPVGGVDASGNLTVRAVGAGHVPRGLAVGPTYELVLTGGAHQRKPFRVTLPLPAAAGNQPTWLAQNRGGETWTAAPATVDTRQRRFSADVGSMSTLGVGWTDSRALTAPLTGLLDRLRSGEPGGTRVPECPDAEQVEKQGITVDAKAPAVRWCTGLTAGRLVVRLVDAMSYPLLVQYEDTATWQGRRGSRAVSWFSDRLAALVARDRNGPATIIGAGEQVEMGIDRIWQGQTTFQLTPDPLATVALVGDTVTELYATVAVDLARFGAVRLPGAAPGVSGVVGALDLDRSCGAAVESIATGQDLASSLADRLGELASCVGQDVARVAAPVGDFMAAAVKSALGIPETMARQAIADTVAKVKDLANEPSGKVTVTYPRMSASQQPGVVFSDGSPRHVLVLDVSGSMADGDGTGTVKIDGAKAAVLTTLDAMPASALVGLRTFPAPGTNCDTRMQSGLTSPTDPALRARVSGLKPDGGTPTARALRDAVGDLQRAGPTPDSTIILVSDGESNCDEDPCAVAREIASLGIAVVNTVGFRLSEQGRNELTCIAEATGGRYLDANDSAGLRQAIATAANPNLAVTLDSPKAGATGDPVPVVAAGETVSVAATVSNVSSRIVNGVTLVVTFPPGQDNVDPGVPGPIRTIGNLQPGEHRQLVWRYEAVAAENQQSRFTIVAAAANAAPAHVEGSIRYAKALNLGFAGPVLAKAKRVAILGDSFSSGEGGGDYLSGSCQRGRNTYAARLFEPAPTVLACAGSTTANIATVGSPGEGPQATQLAALTERPDLALLTLGGGDVGYAEAVLYCVFVPSCQDSTAYPNPGLSPSCLERYRHAHAFETALRYAGKPVADAVKDIPRLRGCVDFAVAFSTLAYARIAALARSLPAAYRAVDRALNGGTIVVLAYPRLTPDYTENRGFCAGLDTGELRFAREFTDRLNSTISAAVTATRRAAVPILFAGDIADAFSANHTICDRQPHANTLDPGHATVGALSPRYAGHELMHPDRDGYLDMTMALVRWSARPEVVSATTRPGSARGSAVPRPGPRVTGVHRMQPVPAAHSGSVPVGARVSVAAGGYAPNTRVTVWIQSVPTAVGSGVAAGDGRVAAQVALPADLAPGIHTIVMVGPGADGSPHWTFLVIDVRRPAPLARIALWALSGILVGVALLLWWLWRRNRRRADPAATGAHRRTDHADAGTHSHATPR